MNCPVIHADETPVRMLDKGKCKRCYICVRKTGIKKQKNNEWGTISTFMFVMCLSGMPSTKYKSGVLGVCLACIF